MKRELTDRETKWWNEFKRHLNRMPSTIELIVGETHTSVAERGSMVAVVDGGGHQSLVYEHTVDSCTTKMKLLPAERVDD